ncbi:hypothetical protein P9274_20085 [Schinkia azotoformans]|uniref:hypothetical protein n=1 Tax=Schinkia azotoformans TaxID=1454 RepID=UPI002E209A07|nr:hypothetical protein [Schinkia azotoformans]
MSDRSKMRNKESEELMMELVCCPHCESILLEHYKFDNGKEKCVCRHCGEWQSTAIQVGDLVRHEDAAYSEVFTVMEVKDEGYVIQGPTPKYSESFAVSREKLLKV